jgi:hypothetical protein
VTLASGGTVIQWHTNNTPPIDEIVLNNKFKGVLLDLKVATANATGLQIEGRLREDTDWFDLASSPGDFAGGNPFVFHSRVYTSSTGAYVNSDATTIDSGQAAFLVLSTADLQALRITGTSAGTAALTGYAVLTEDTPASGIALDSAGRVEVDASGITLDVDSVSEVAAPENSSQITAGDATTPATWLGNLTDAQLTLDSDENGVILYPTGTEYTVYIAALDDSTWRYLAQVTVPAYGQVRVLCKHKGLAFGTVGGGAIRVSAVRL